MNVRNPYSIIMYPDAMEFEIRNIGIVRDGTIALDGLTVILGECGAGKSTVLKALYAVAKSASESESSRMTAVEEIIEQASSDMDPDACISSELDSVRLEVRRLVGSGGDAQAVELLGQAVDGLRRIDRDAASGLEEAVRILDGEDEGRVLSVAAAGFLRDEFCTVRHLREAFAWKDLSAIIRDDAAWFGLVIYADTGSRWIGGIRDEFRDVLFYDTPLVMDAADDCTFRWPYGNGHRGDLAYRLGPARGFVSEATASDEELCGILEPVLGDAVREKPAHLFSHPLSDGMKVFAVLYSLFRYGDLERGSLLLLDCPENGMHPGWQEILARAIVHLVGDRGVRVVMATQSPHLLSAMESEGKGLQIDRYSMRTGSDGTVSITGLDGDPHAVPEDGGSIQASRHVRNRDDRGFVSEASP